ncbi:sensor histidine kinase [Gracilibacillus salinarum]|uniref:histidine kinase n=1 Tax=Gracilibacillus salinarum TaxID=2932255 RepID=A0ABY4GW94_9BACI|nr:histidine kinase [Gracilibacillus salinarum]UOQ87367.1 histidine kinase [Gracilibacillus salinarum]
MGFWIWFLLWILTWSGAIWLEWWHGSVAITYLLLMMALFFAVFFFTSMGERVFGVLWFVLIVIVSVAFIWPVNAVFNPFVLLMFCFILAIMIRRAEGWSLYLLVAAWLLALFGLHIQYSSTSIILFFLLLSTSLFLFVYYYKQHVVDQHDISLRYQALLQTYRQLKRDSVAKEQWTRQQERVFIGREIHDRVGHTLTNLLMQIEILRLQNDNKDLEQLKQLTQESLSETRKAVRALQDDNETGLAAILHLIRKLEAEQYISIQFSMKQNVLSVVLNPDQAVVLYRAIQEALTNVMRHSSDKEAVIVLEVPGLSIFRFEVISPIEQQTEIKKGFGLNAMSERLAQINGSLEIQQFDQQFIIRGQFPLEEVTR